MDTQANETELLTDDMIRDQRDEATAAGDWAMAHTCQRALDQSGPLLTVIPDALRLRVRRACAMAINAARAKDDSTTFVRVVVR